MFDNTEAIANIASVYNNKELMVLPKLKVTGEASIDGALTANGDVNLNGKVVISKSKERDRMVIYTDDDMKRYVYINNENKMGGVGGGLSLENINNLNVGGLTTIKSGIDTSVAGNDTKVWYTHLPFNDGKNYIRGDTIINGKVTIDGSLGVKSLERGIRTVVIDGGNSDIEYNNRNTNLSINDYYCFVGGHAGHRNAGINPNNYCYKDLDTKTWWVRFIGYRIIIIGIPMPLMADSNYLEYRNEG